MAEAYHGLVLYPEGSWEKLILVAPKGWESPIARSITKLTQSGSSTDLTPIVEVSQGAYAAQAISYNFSDLNKVTLEETLDPEFYGLTPMHIRVINVREPMFNDEYFHDPNPDLVRRVIDSVFSQYEMRDYGQEVVIPHMEAAKKRFAER